MTVRCTRCGAEHPIEARFCNACGASLRTTCPACGTEQPTAAFCSACGAALAPTAEPEDGADAREERRLVTILFADLIGSTAFGDGVDPEDLREIQASFAAMSAREIERFGGVVEKFIGDAVMAVFGIPQAHEDDAERALLAALAVRDAFGELAERVAARHGAELGIRVGVNTGEVVAGPAAATGGEQMVSGDAVNVAARLEQHAEPGTVLAGGRTRAAAARAVEFRPHEPILAKGKGEPVEAWVALAPAERPERRGGVGLEAPLVGRAQELAVLAAVAARVEQERVPQVVTLFGAAGVGKSRLLAEFVRRLPDARLLRGRCVPYGDGVTYRPLADVAKDHAGILENDAASVALDKLAAAIGSVVSPDAADGVVEAVATTIGLVTAEAVGDRRPWLHDAWAKYVAALGRERLTVIAIEDVHWASDALLDALDHLAESLADTAVLLVCPARPELLEGRRTWGAGRQNATSLTVPPLRPGETADLVGSLLGTNVPEALLESVLARAEGNPFFVEEILRMLIESGALEPGNGGYVAVGPTADIRLPDSVHGVIAARLDLLEGTSRGALLRCAVVGRVFWPAAVDVEPERVDALVRRGLVVERSDSTMAGLREFAFKHALTHEVAYATLPRTERRVLHRRVGEWILGVAPDRAAETAELAAYHLSEAIAYGDDDAELRRRAVELLLQAGEGALSRGAWMSAEPLFDRALELADDDAARGALLLGRGRALNAAGRLDEAHAALEAARAAAEAAGDGALVGDVLGWLSRVSWVRGDWDGALRAAADAIGMLEPFGESPQLARALARQSQLAMLRDDPRAVERAQEAIALARRVGDSFAEVNARINLGSALGNDGIEGDPREVRELMELAVRAGAPDEATRALVNWLWSAHAYLPLPVVSTELERAAEITRGFPYLEGFESYYALSVAKFVDLPAGRWAEIDRALRTVPLTAGARLLWHDVASGMALRRGDLARVDQLLPGYRREALASDELQRIVPMLDVAIPRASVEGDVAQLEELVELLLSQAGALSPRFGFTATPRALAHAGAFELLRRVESELRSLPAPRLAWRLRVAAETATALIALSEGRSQESVARLEQLVAAETSLGRPYDAGCLELDLANALEAAGRTDDAREVRARALSFLDSLGCVYPY